MPKIRSAKDLETQDSEVLSDEPRALIVGGATQRGSTALVVKKPQALYGTRAFFKAAAEQLVVSTKHGLELAGACFTDEHKGRVILTGLSRKGSGRPGRVAIDSRWGGVLWHTHPGLKGSLAAFSNEDLGAAKQAKKPLLVIGFGGLSPDVLSTAALPLGIRAFLIAGGVKAILSLERRGKLQERLLDLGVSARVCYPDGTIKQVVRLNASPLRLAFEDVSFLIDKSVGSVERRGQALIKDVISKIAGT